MSTPGYYRYPTIHGDNIVFVAEDDLWMISTEDILARRLTSNLGEVSHPCFSPDGEFIAFTGREEGHAEVYLMPALGGPEKRLTYLGTNSQVTNWSPDGKSILFATNANQPFRRKYVLYSVDRDGGLAIPIPIGAAQDISYGPSGGVVIGRNTTEPARWKRYRGGMVGVLWVDVNGSGEFKKLIELDGNMASPMWFKDRIFFLSDHEGIGNLYSCTPDGEDLRRHTDHEEYYLRNASTDGKRIVAHAGADICIYEPESDEERKVEVEFHSPRIQRSRKFVDASKYMERYSLHPKGHSVAIVSRGKPFTMGNWEGAVVQHGEPDGVRYRLTQWLNDGKRLVTVSDAGGEEALEIHYTDGSQKTELLDNLDIGIPSELAVSPKADEVVLSNHRFELIHVDLESKQSRVLDKSKYSRIAGFDWSSDGKWIAYGFSLTDKTTSIKLCKVDTGENWEVTKPVLRDVSPVFEPEGKYLYFLSYREFNPVYDNLHFDLNFPRGMIPCLITLQKELSSPFVPEPKPLVEDKEEKKKNDNTQDNSKDNEKKEEKVKIDLEGIEGRILAFPVPEGRYGEIYGIKGKALFTSHPVKGSLGQSWRDEDNAPKSILEVYDFEKQKKETIVSEVDNFKIGRDNKTLIYKSGRKLRVMKAGEKSDEEKAKKGPRRESGWLDLGRIKVSVDREPEWRQMYREAWRLQREHFWTPNMSNVDWELIYNRYEKLLPRITTRSEFSDLIWEMQGELGTSHAYETGGDYRSGPYYAQGFLGADFEYDEEKDCYRIVYIVQGDTWKEGKDSPLNAPGININAGDELIAIGGRRLSKTLTPNELLVNQAGREVNLTFLTDDEEEPTRTVCVKALKNETPARYREWVQNNREKVHKKTNGRVGYVHIPDMGPEGYAEFHRYYLTEISHDALIVDVRCNSGGHVSELLLEKLARERIGYDVPRWGEPMPYPGDSVLGPIVALNDEFAGSDGDIFSHGFKLMNLGLLIGKRTWGGVIGISFRYSLVDGSTTTQPEYSFWFKDVGWGVENYGTEPDIEVEIKPQDYAQGKDRQLERAIAEVMKQLEENPPEKPDFSNSPDRSLPKLPPR